VSLKRLHDIEPLKAFCIYNENERAAVQSRIMQHACSFHFGQFGVIILSSFLTTTVAVGPCDHGLSISARDFS